METRTDESARERDEALTIVDLVPRAEQEPEREVAENKRKGRIPLYNKP